jgi:DNA-directed RNA polymerase subunit RPC12/RpoP
MECLVVVVGLIVCVAVGAAICQEKGRPALQGVLLGLLLGPIGVVICAILPRNVTALETSGLTSGAMRKCPYCAEPIRSEAVVCRYCGREIPVAALDKVLYTGDGLLAYKCRNCGKTYDLAERDRCPHCQWREPSRKRILDVYKRQAGRDTA